jgi:hypothetical protein
MLRDPGIESVLRRELDSLPLPPEEQWLPGRGRSNGFVAAAWLLAGSLLIVLAFVAGPALRDWRDSVSAATAARPTPLVLPTVINGIGVSPLRKIVREAALGYNLLLPANWRQSDRAQTQAAVMLVARATYTARSSAEEAAVATRYDRSPTLPWDVTAELWSRGPLSALEWARTHGRCSGACAFGSTQINGVSFVTTVDGVTGVHAFYVERADRVLVFSYVVGSPAEQPQGVTTDTLEQIVASIGLP